ncbi:MAG: hypothetical protein QW117_01200 [Candidatus Pacearchaeota archaeon]
MVIEDIKKYNLLAERKNVLGDKILLRENNFVVGWYNIDSLISFLKEKYRDKRVDLVVKGFNNIEKKEIINGIEKLLKENKNFLIEFI